MKLLCSWKWIQICLPRGDSLVSLRTSSISPYQILLWILFRLMSSSQMAFLCLYLVKQKGPNCVMTWHILLYQQSTPTSSYARNGVGSDRKVCCSSFRLRRRFPNRMLKKHSELVRPTSKKFNRRSYGSKTRAGFGKVREEKISMFKFNISTDKCSLFC